MSSKLAAAKKPVSSDSLSVLKLFDRAVDFEYAASLLLRQIYKDWKRGGNKSGSAATPHVLNSSFCLELFLKCAVHIDRGKPWKNTHRLLDLFRAMSPMAQRRITRIYDDIRRRDAAKLSVQEKRATLLQVLTESSTAFPDWRYSFEGKATLTYSAHPAIEAVKRFILEQRPHWTPGFFVQKGIRSTSRVR